jgi:ElaB/YqjD/DUF883 family membrane-anchored ribosome-binding protein
MANTWLTRIGSPGAEWITREHCTEAAMAMPFRKSRTTIEDIREQLKVLSEGVSQLVEQVADVAGSTGEDALGGMKKAKRNLDNVVSLAGDRGREAQAAVTGAARDAVGTREEVFHARPLLAIAIAVAVGYLLAAVRRR